MAGLPPLDPDAGHALEPTPKWVRAVVGGRVVADSRRAVLVRPPRSPPRTYAFPPADVTDAPEEARVEVDGYVALQWDAVDHWFEESEEVFVHPRDPHTRIDVLRSRRHVVVERDGQRLAESQHPVLLFEDVPNLPVRYYLPLDDCDLSRLRRSDHHSACPYKGFADYFDVRVGGRWMRDLAWTYPAPFREVDPVRGLVAFWNERVDLTVDGERLERPRSPFS